MRKPAVLVIAALTMLISIGMGRANEIVKLSLSKQVDRADVVFVGSFRSMSVCDDFGRQTQCAVYDVSQIIEGDEELLEIRIVADMNISELSIRCCREIGRKYLILAESAGSNYYSVNGNHALYLIR